MVQVAKEILEMPEILVIMDLQELVEMQEVLEIQEIQEMQEVLEAAVVVAVVGLAPTGVKVHFRILVPLVILVLQEPEEMGVQVEMVDLAQFLVVLDLV
jgi:hypothetical protein